MLLLMSRTAQQGGRFGENHSMIVVNSKPACVSRLCMRMKLHCARSTRESDPTEILGKHNMTVVNSPQDQEYVSWL